MNLFFILLILQICFTKSFNFITNSFITYSGYSLLVDLWASKQVEKMKKRCNFEDKDDTDLYVNYDSTTNY